jgi:hypothetical protein
MQTNVSFLLTGVYLVLQVNTVGKEIRNSISPAFVARTDHYPSVDTLNNIPGKRVLQLTWEGSLI